MSEDNHYDVGNLRPTGLKMARRIELTPEQLQSSLELRDLRWSFSAIGRELKIDRRIIAEVVKEREQAQRWQELAGARRDVAAKYLDIHVGDLENLSRDLLELTIPPYLKSKNTSVETNIEEVLARKTEEHLRGRVPRILVMGHTVEQDYPEETLIVDARLFRREARELIAAHQEHFPSVWKTVTDWQNLGVKHNAALKQFTEEFERGCDNAKIPLDLRKPAEQELMRRPVPDSDEDRFFVKRSSTALTPEQAADQLMDGHMLKPALKSLVQYRGSLQRLFERLEDDLTPGRQLRTILTGHCRYCPVP